MDAGNEMRNPLDRRSVLRRHIRLPNDPESVKLARDEVAAALHSAHWPEESIERARVITSELATNALTHAHSGFELDVRVADDAWIEVADGAGDESPMQAERDELRPSGMGLYLVEALAASWGMQRQGSGKIVWACLTRAPLTTSN